MTNKNYKINLVLFQPENIGNLANIIRTVYILNIQLHLIKPYGFIGDLKFLTSSNIQKKLCNFSKNTISKITYFEHISWDNFYQKLNLEKDQICYYSVYAKTSLEDAQNILDFNKNIYCVLGSETFGLTKLPITNPQPLLALNFENNKSYNLANAAAIICYLLKYVM